MLQILIAVVFTYVAVSPAPYVVGWALNRLLDSKYEHPDDWWLNGSSFLWCFAVVVSCAYAIGQAVLR